tara:strand:+ start:15272 stop:16327 length:1056 start_codon:yes stop_codon:yes gene_type:complete
MKNITFANSINEAIEVAMSIDKNVICYGLGATDPKGIFGTTLGLEEKFGSERVFDMPTSENAMTGVAIGASISGIKTIMTHQRLDFFLLAMDQIVNSAAKMHYMFNGELNVPLTVRLILGRGWGQGPTHSQNLQSWFAHIPGLKVVMPSSAEDAKGLLISSIFDPNPVIFLEHRWLHNSSSEVPEGDYRIPLGKAKKIKEGNDFTIVSMSYLTAEALIAAKYLKQFGIEVDLIDLRSIKPLDLDTIVSSLSKTGRILVLDTGASTCSVASDIISKLSTKYFSYLKDSPCILTMPDIPEPTSFELTKGFYIRAADIANEILQKLKIENANPYKDIPEPDPHDIPGEWFKGPF